MEVKLAAKLIILYFMFVILLWNLRKNTSFNLRYTDARVFMAKVANNWVQGSNGSNTQFEYDDEIVDKTLYLTSENLFQSEHDNKEELSRKDSFQTNDVPIVASQPNEMKTILFWNECHHSFDYGIGLGNESLVRLGCPVYQCSFTSDKAQLGTVDAVVIHGLLVDPPTRRSENQIYVWHYFESPIQKFSNLSQSPIWQDVFNLTFTYMHDAGTDISANHGRAVRLPTPDPSAVPELDEIKMKNEAGALDCEQLPCDPPVAWNTLWNWPSMYR